MKLLDIIPFETESDPNAVTTIELDSRQDLFFSVHTSAYHTPKFNKKATFVPVIMNHADREETGVKISVSNNTLVIEQVYQMATNGLVMIIGNNDWTDSGELSKLVIKTDEIAAVVDSSGVERAISISNSGNSVILSLPLTSNSPNVYIREVILLNGSTYMTAFSMSGNRTSSDLPYTNFKATVDPYLTVYK